MIGIATILVPVDFSDASKKAIRYGLSLAVEADAKVILAHVVPFSPAVPYAHPYESRTMTESDGEEIRTKLGELVAGDLKGAVEVDCRVRTGDIQDELLQVAEEADADLIVMGTHGRRRFERWLLGSVTEGVLRRSPVPALTVSHIDSEHALEEPGPIPLKKILCATDLSAGSVDVITRSMEWSRQFSAELLILHVVPDVRWAYGAEQASLDIEVDKAALHRGVTHRLMETIPDSIRKDPRVRSEVREGIPFETILAVVEEEKADLIVLNTSSRPGIERALLGSTAERVVRGAHVPVLSFPPTGSGEKVETKAKSPGSILI